MIGSRNFAFLLMAVRFWLGLRFRVWLLLLIVLHHGCDLVEDIFGGSVYHRLGDFGPQRPSSAHLGLRFFFFPLDNSPSHSLLSVFHAYALGSPKSI